jgi:hypothetical protein
LPSRLPEIQRQSSACSITPAARHGPFPGPLHHSQDRDLALRMGLIAHSNNRGIRLRTTLVLRTRPLLGVVHEGPWTRCVPGVGNTFRRRRILNSPQLHRKTQNRVTARPQLSFCAACCAGELPCCAEEYGSCRHQTDSPAVSSSYPSSPLPVQHQTGRQPSTNFSCPMSGVS